MHLKVAVCPHDSTKNKVTWLYFITYLSQRVGLDLTMEQCFEFECYYRSFPHVDMTYSNPLDALKIHKERGFIPVAGNDNYDEVVVIANRDAEPRFEAIDGKEVLCAENQFASYLGMRILNREGISYRCGYRSSWQSVLNDVAKGKAPYGLLYKDFWDQLSGLSRSGVVPIYESDERLSSHIIMLVPELSQYRSTILWALEEMPKDEEGAKIMEQLRIDRWYPVDSLEYLEKLIQED
ncbi:PhnD/SsuA/transferrin family substrate-binding protein [Hydrogenivirga sp.]